MTKSTVNHQLLARHSQRLQARLNHLDQISDRYTWIRLGLVTGGGLLSILVAILNPYAVLVWINVIIVLFVWVVRRHRRIIDTADQLRIWQQIKATHMARLALDWSALPPPTFNADSTHPFENDFDVTGPYSLHRLLDTTTSLEASRRLREWLLVTEPDMAASLQRQNVVRELRHMPQLRDKLTLKATPSARQLGQKQDLQHVRNWLKQHHAVGNLDRMLWVSAGLVGLNILLFVLDQLNVLPPLWQLTFVIYLGVNLWHPEIRGLFENALSLRSLMAHLDAVLSLVETHPMQGRTHLEDLCQPIRRGNPRPSQQLRRLNRLLSAAGLQKNGIAWLMVNALIPWDMIVARELNRTRAILSGTLPQWLDVWIELEALSALATFADLHPDTTFPDLHPNPDHQPLFEAERMGHPLLDPEKRVDNDFVIKQEGDIAILTGSNMAGKSTFLRTVGLNLALAYAGGAVVAAHLETVPFRLFACIRVTDSVTDGISYFYAEVRRLKALMETLHQTDDLPMLYLIDEIFRGTNNRERLQGSRAYVRALVGEHGVGIIATHDLELVKLADEFERIRNYHFRDEVRDGKMYFDFRLHEGPCPTTNALKIMAMEGLPVEGMEMVSE